MRKRLYEAFTLVEMLIVMGILIILMVVGITAGRFAINRANDVAHQNAADQVYQGLQAYYTDNREFPAGTYTVATLIGDPGACTSPTNPLCDYMDSGAFNGGTEATYYYFVESDQQQSVLVCVSLGGIDDDRERGIYCSGNGFGDDTLEIGTSTTTGTAVTGKSIPYSTEDPAYLAIDGSTGANWHGDSDAWTAPAAP
jgi:type II secretory pathway pseudopilin PulG